MIEKPGDRLSGAPGGTVPVAPWSRVLILIAALVAACLLSYSITGSILPEEPGAVLVFQNALLLVVLGSALLEYKFTAPG
jgi:hypothetical protein